jgi:hypothetical protein
MNRLRMKEGEKGMSAAEADLLPDVLLTNSKIDERREEEGRGWESNKDGEKENGKGGERDKEKNGIFFTE